MKKGLIILAMALVLASCSQKNFAAKEDSINRCYNSYMRVEIGKNAAFVEHQPNQCPEIYGLQASFEEDADARLLVIPPGIKALHINGLKNAAGLEIPEGVEMVNFNGLTDGADLRLPSSVRDLRFYNVTNIKNLDLTRVGSLRHLYFYCLETLDGVTLPETFNPNISGGNLIMPECFYSGQRLPRNTRYVACKTTDGPPMDIRSLFMRDSRENADLSAVSAEFIRIDGEKVVGIKMPSSLKTLRLPNADQVSLAVDGIELSVRDKSVETALSGHGNKITYESNTGTPW